MIARLSLLPGRRFGAMVSLREYRPKRVEVRRGTKHLLQASEAKKLRRENDDKKVTEREKEGRRVREGERKGGSE